MLAAAHTIHVYTDGSHDPSSLPHPTSSWAVTIADQWLEDNFGTVPADESMVRPHHLHGATIFGASIACTQGVYPAELQAIARALAMFPLSFTLHVHSDSKSSLQAIHRFESLTNERARLRMPAHTILHLILHLLQARLSAGGSVHWHHVRAHTNNDDIHSVGNRLADFVANKARLKPDRQQPLSLRELPLPQCEMHLRVVLGGGAGLQLIDDARSAATLHMQHSALEHWQQKKDNTRFFASQAISHLGRVVLKHGSAELQASFVLLATHSLHYMWLPDKAGLHEMQCDTCAAPIDDLSDSEDDRNHYLTPSHLTSCTDTIGVRFRERLRLQIINTLHPHPAAQPWLRQHQHASLSSILLSLCPTSAAASAANQPRHLTYVMCGVLTTTQVNAAVRTLGFTDPLDVTQGQRAVRALQLLCLDHVRQVYATRKDRILRAA